MTDRDEIEALARDFHEAYERLAPEFGYETREETRTFDPRSRNGQLMIAVCGELARRLRAGVPDRKTAGDSPGFVPPEDGQAAQYWADGWNECRDALLSAAPAPEAAHRNWKNGCSQPCDAPNGEVPCCCGAWHDKPEAGQGVEALAEASDFLLDLIRFVRGEADKCDSSNDRHFFDDQVKSIKRVESELRRLASAQRAPADAITAMSAMKDAAMRAHRICYETMLRYPDVPELGDDGELHKAIHAIVGVDTPGYVAAELTDEAAQRLYENWVGKLSAHDDGPFAAWPDLPASARDAWRRKAAGEGVGDG